MRARGQFRGGVGNRTVRQKHFSGKHFRADTEPLLQLVAHIAAQ